MLAEGNGTAQQCAFNLMSMIQGECPYDRCKGMDAAISDQPSTGALGSIVTATAWVLKYYEPRAQAGDIGLLVESALQGRYRIVSGMLVDNG
jgi:hypothetical protein